MSKISCFTGKAVTLIKNAVADYAIVSLHCLRIYLKKSYREALYLLSEMHQILAEIGLEKADLPDHSTLVEVLDRIKMAVWRVLLRLSAQLHEPSVHVAMDATFFDRENASKHYCVGRIIVFGRSKQPLSSIQRHELSSKFTARRETSRHTDRLATVT